VETTGKTTNSNIGRIVVVINMRRIDEMLELSVKHQAPLWAD
jgi:hypothetical protein